MAVEKAKSAGRQIEMMVIEDDVSVGRKQGGRVGRRGLAGAVLVHKIVGGFARQGTSLKECKDLAESVMRNTVTVAASLSHASVPGSTGEMNLAADEIELGMGIHNEPGCMKVKTPTASDLVRILLKQLLDQGDTDRAFVNFKSGDKVVLMVNNLGALSSLELYQITYLVSCQLAEYELNVVRTYAGMFMTSLNGAGVSITLLNLADIDSNAVIQALDMPTDAPGWNSACTVWSALREVSTTPENPRKSDRTVDIDGEVTKNLISAACNALVEAEPEITEYDTITGDGDAGTTLKSAAEAILKALDEDKISTINGIDTFHDIATVLEETMGGTSGALYTIFFNALSHSLRGSTTELLADAISQAVDRLRTYTTAQVGDKTLMDALLPFSDNFKQSKQFSEAVECAIEGAEATTKMTPGLGRATYSTSTRPVPDPGAMGLKILLQSLLRVYVSSPSTRDA